MTTCVAVAQATSILTRIDYRGSCTSDASNSSPKIDGYQKYSAGDGDARYYTPRTVRRHPYDGE